MLLKLSIPGFWCKRKIISYLLFPVSLIYRFCILLRKFFYKLFLAKKLSVPIIVVGNIVIGGAGKTPLVIALANILKENGYTPGIITRGYGRKPSKDSIHVNGSSTVEDVGDEPLFIFRHTECPVVVNIDRVKAVECLMSNNYGCDVVISDDGLQHYRLDRDIEIAVIDNEFKFGNGFCLPAGPLREPVSRLNEVDFVLYNYNLNFLTGCCKDKPVKDCQSDYTPDAVRKLIMNRLNSAEDFDGDVMFLAPKNFKGVKNTKATKTVADFVGKNIHAVAGIGRPDKFFQGLKKLGLNIIEHPFPDHYRYSAADFQFEDETVIMTEKDAVKCADFASENFWYVEVEAVLSDRFIDGLLDKLKATRR